MKSPIKNRYLVIGQMSGTSLDGIDLVAAEFEFSEEKWKYKIVDAQTTPYTKEWDKKLRTAHLLQGSELLKIHSEYGKFLAENINLFKKDFQPDLIATHGHTIFHQPENGFTFQLGNGSLIASGTGIITVADFRQPDVSLGGQGAPLVPAGDKLLFGEFDYCLNLGGFANISFDDNSERIAFDICPANIVLNYFAAKHQMPFDKEGRLGRSGKIKTDLFQKLNSIEFYAQKPPKSLGREWVEKEFLPFLEIQSCSEPDKIRTVYEHIAFQIAKVSGSTAKMLVTGGGAHNSFLVERIVELSKAKVVIPDITIVNFKEALIFAFLGILKIRNEINCFSSVTGAVKDHSTGVVFIP
jgi:anhydro-N-acetylmuramic acid kinase